MTESLYPDGSDTVFPYSGTCARCLRERDDLFWHRFDRAFYCADVFRCEQRYYVSVRAGRLEVTECDIKAGGAACSVT